MADAEVSMASSGNLFIKMMHFKSAGDTMQGHRHTFDHMTLLASGAVSVEVEGQVTEFEAPHMIWISAGKLHQIVATKDGTVACCIHALRNAEATDVLDPKMIPAGVSPLALAASLTLDEG